MLAKSSNNHPSTSRRHLKTILGYVLWVMVCFIGVQLFVALLFVATQAAGVTYDAFSDNTVLLVLRLIMLGLMVGAVIWLPQLLPNGKPTGRAVLGTDRPVQWRDIGVGVAGVVVAFIGSMVVLQLAQWLMTWIDVGETQNLGLSMMNSGSELLLAFIVLVVASPLVEELIFRGYLYGWLRKRGIGAWLTALIVSALFALVHLQWNVALDVFVLSLVMCYAREKTGAVWASVIIHALKNLIAFYFVFVNPTLTGIF